MMAMRQVETVWRGSLPELLGPAEGQYTVTFQETLTQDIPCIDVYSFTLDEETEGLCFSALRGTTPTGPSQLGIELFSVDTCAAIFTNYAVAPDTLVRVCLPSLPAGEYLLAVGGLGLEGTWPYTLTVEAPGPIGLTFTEDDACDYLAPCFESPVPLLSKPR
jgi:hypothetical protein